MFLMYEEMEKTDMFLIAHMGDPRVDVSGPSHMLPIAETFPRLRCIASHLGNWGDWDVEKIRPLAQLPNVYTDISSSFSYVKDHKPLYEILRCYDPTHVFFGSDYPIWCPKKELQKTLSWISPLRCWRISCSIISRISTTIKNCKRAEPAYSAAGNAAGGAVLFRNSIVAVL